MYAIDVSLQGAHPSKAPSQEARLMEHLLSNYTPAARPVRDSSHPVQLTLSLAMSKIDGIVSILYLFL